MTSTSHMADCERGEVLFMLGAPAQFVAVIGAGYVKMTRTSHSGQEVAIELLGPGQAFGLLAAIEGRTFPLNAVALTQGWYVKIPARAIVSVYKSNEGLKDVILRHVGDRLRHAHDMMIRVSSGRVQERIAAVLCNLAQTYGTRHEMGTRLEVPLTRQEISEMAGATVETTIRVLSRWQKEGLIVTDRQQITICDEEALRAMFADPTDQK